MNRGIEPSSAELKVIQDRRITLGTNQGESIYSALDTLAGSPLVDLLRSRLSELFGGALVELERATAELKASLEAAKASVETTIIKTPQPLAVGDIIRSESFSYGVIIHGSSRFSGKCVGIARDPSSDCRFSSIDSARGAASYQVYEVTNSGDQIHILAKRLDIDGKWMKDAEVISFTAQIDPESAEVSVLKNLPLPVECDRDSLPSRFSGEDCAKG